MDSEVQDVQRTAKSSHMHPSAQEGSTQDLNHLRSKTSLKANKKLGKILEGDYLILKRKKRKKHFP